MGPFFSNFPGKYFAGDGLKRDAHGSYWITARERYVLNNSGPLLNAKKWLTG
jgi:acetyl-CoA synthetase